jgi:hypothetical protein
MINNIENQRGFTILSALLSTDRNDASVDIANSISDIDIHEHLDKPYLTANIVLLDTHALLQQINLQGIEKLDLKLETLNKNIIEKTFRITKILKSVRGDDRSEVIALHAVEDHAYVSNAINVNKAYTGTPASMITKIATDHLEKAVDITDDTFQGNMKVIIPNMNPIEAIKWLQQRATNRDGLPYYIYSVLADNNLHFRHLGSLLQQPPSNPNNPFVYSQAAAQDTTSNNKYFVIESYKHENAENLFELIGNGHVGARYNFINLSEGFERHVDFDVKEDVFDVLKDKNYLQNNQNNYNYPVNAKISGTDLNKRKSKVISRVTASNLYSGFGDFKSYSEEIKASDYKKQICGEAIRHHMTKSAITIGVNGSPFLMNGANLTIGTVIRLKFFDSNVNANGQRANFIDTKKSGDYIIHATKHSFKIEKYDLNMVCTKIADYTGENL